MPDLFDPVPVYSGHRDNPWIGLIHFLRKLIVLLKWTLFLAWPHIQGLQISFQLCSNIDIKDSGPTKFCKGPIEISKGPLKLCILHVFECHMGHWPILRAHHHFGLGVFLRTS